MHNAAMLIKVRRAPESRKDRWSAVAFAVVGLALAVGAYVLLLVSVPARHVQERDFTKAHICPAAGRAATSPDCIRSVTATVKDVKADHSRRTTHYWLSLTEGDGTVLRVKMNDMSYPVVDIARKGDQVTAWSWRKQIRFVELNGERQYTDADPRGTYHLPAAIGTALPSLALYAFWCAYWLARRSGASPKRAPWQTSVWGVAALFVAGIGALGGFSRDSTAATLRYTAIGAAPVLLVATAVAVWNVLRDRRTKSDGIEVEPLVPAEEEIFGGVILGDVPYSVEGFNVIVAGPDGLASTPDPTANIARRPVPPTLEVVRVRPSYRSDPVQAVPGSHVAECRDGETTVLIVVDSKNLPWVLGALQASRPAAPKEPAPAE